MEVSGALNNVNMSREADMKFAEVVGEHSVLYGF
jgi:hypothetical protein